MCLYCWSPSLPHGLWPPVSKVLWFPTFLKALLGTVDCTQPIFCTLSRLVNVWMLLLTTLCISVFSKSIHSLFSNTAPLRLSLSHWSQTQCRVSLKVMWSPKSSRLVASKVVGRKKREEAAYVTRGAFGNVWGMLSVCHNDWGEC